jgi:hypothetical protein
MAAMAAALTAALGVGSTLREGSGWSGTLRHLQTRIGILPACQVHQQQQLTQLPGVALLLLLMPQLLVVP